MTGFKSSNITSKVEKNLNSFLKNGNDINLSVDLRVQSIVHKELSESLKKYDANSAVTIIINVHNGEILSLVSLPDFDPNHPENIKAFTENNLATEARYEMGSTLKIFNAALAFENELNLEKRNFRVDKGYQITSEKLIEDKHIKKELINFEEIFTKSSNVGSIKLIEEIGIKKQKLFLKKLGLKENLNLNGLNIVNNKIPDHWDHLASKFISYGYGLSLSPISLVSVYLTLVNGGFKVDPSIMLNANSHKKQILKKETSIKVNNLLKKIVDNGTGKKAKVIGLEVGGKTGTSRKLENGKYSEKSNNLIYWYFPYK